MLTACCLLLCMSDSSQVWARLLPVSAPVCLNSKSFILLRWCLFFSELRLMFANHEVIVRPVAHIHTSANVTIHTTASLMQCPLPAAACRSGGRIVPS